MIKNYIHRLKFDSRGYTLVEMLAVIIVFIIIGGIIVAIFASSLRGSNKVNVVNKVRQNGNYAMLQMTRMIGYAKNFDGVSINSEGPFISCYIPPVGLNTPTPTPLEYHYLKITNFDGGQTIFSCDTNSIEKISSNSASLINVELVTVDECKITCTQSSASQPPTIKINFTLSQKKQTSFFEKQATIPFEASIVIRNY